MKNQKSLNGMRDLCWYRDQYLVTEKRKDLLLFGHHFIGQAGRWEEIHHVHMPFFVRAPLITVWTVSLSQLDVRLTLKSHQMKGCAEWLWVSTLACDCKRGRVTFNLLQFLQPVTLSWLHTHCGTLGYTLELGFLAGTHSERNRREGVCVETGLSSNHQC